MFIIISGSVGFIIGVIGSTNPIVWIIVGGTFSLVAWSLTGFKIGSKSIAVNDSPIEQKKSNEMRFIFSDGKQLTPAEYGYVSCQWSVGEAKTALDDCFQSNKNGQPFPGYELVEPNPFIAHMLFFALEVGVYLTYAQDILRADAKTMEGVYKGVNDFLQCIKTPNGLTLNRLSKDELFNQENFLALIKSFVKAIVLDIDCNQNMDAQTLKPIPAMESTKLLLALINKFYSKEPLFINVGQAEYLIKTNILDSIPINLLSVLKEQYRVSLAPE